MNKKNLIIVIIILIIFLSLILYFSPQKNKVCLKRKCFDVELAQTPQEQTMGLMFRKSLDKNSGMLFIFQKEEQHDFWMKDTLIPLDIIWINSKKEVIHIEKSVQPCVSPPCEILNSGNKSLYVLEINSGKSDEIGLKEGDKISIYLT